MSTTLTHTSIPAQSTSIDWSDVGARLIARFPTFPAADVLAELVSAHDAALYVGTAESDLADVVEFMATYAMKVRSGEVTPSDRLDPEKHAAPRRATDDE
jgi:hypothetical protein